MVRRTYFKIFFSAEDAFWSLVSICEYFIPGYYDEGLTAIQMDGMVLQALLQKHNRSV